MSNTERSSNIFDLIEDAGISLKSGSLITPESYAHFRHEYLEWSTRRDSALLHHLGKTPRAFRCLLKHSDRVFATAYHVLWYLDEVVVADPIARALADKPDDRDQNSLASLKRTLELLARFRQSIESGYLLLGGAAVVPQLPKDSPQPIVELAARDDIQQVLDRAVRLGMATRRGSDGMSSTVYDAKLDTGFIIGFSIPARGPDDAAQYTTANYTVGEDLPRHSVDDIAKAVNTPSAVILDQVRRIYPREVHATLQNVAIASRLGACALIDRDTDQEMLSQIVPGPTSPNASVGAFNLALPYLEGVPPDRLLELRQAIPAAFTEFRARLADIAERAIKEDGSDFQLRARTIAERELVPAVRYLDTEMRAAANKARILGYVSPVVASVGALIGEFVFKLPSSTIFSAVMAGLVPPIAAAAQYAADKKNATKNPFYFVWKAQKG